MSETWVQEYSAGFPPGEDGNPTRVTRGTQNARDLILIMVAEYDHRGPQQHTTYRDVKGGRLTQHWVKVR